MTRVRLLSTPVHGPRLTVARSATRQRERSGACGGRNRSMPRDGSDVNGALETSRGDRGARVKAVRIAGDTPVSAGRQPGPVRRCASRRGYETGKPRNTCHLVLPASNERRERRVLIVRDDCIEHLEGGTVHRSPSGVPPETLPGKFGLISGFTLVCPSKNPPRQTGRQHRRRRRPPGEYPLSPIS